MANRRQSKRLRTLQGDGISHSKAGEGATVELYSNYARTEVPGGSTLAEAQKNSAYAKARILRETNYWLKCYFDLKMSIINFGRQLSPKIESKGSKTTKPKAKDVAALDAWLDEVLPAPEFTGNKTIGFPNKAEVKRREKINKLIDEAIEEFNLQRNVIAFWMDAQLPVLLALDKCRYKDVLGIETLFYTHGLSAQEIQVLPPEQQARFRVAEIAVGEAEGEFFKVLKTERTGFGLSWPSLQAMFRTASVMESMEMGESSYAYGGRQHCRHHKIGHPIESGPMSGKPTHFWNKKRGDAVRKIHENKVGFLGDLTSNFDQEPTWPHEDLDYYKEDKWLSPEHRLNVWGGPLAQMMIPKNTALGLHLLLRAEMLDDRAKLGPFLESVINQGFDPPVPIQLNWSNLIFNDLRTLSEMIKFGVTSGAVSQSTFREVVGFDDNREAIKKEEEAAEFEKTPQKFKPAYDPAHGDPNDQGGKPAGTQDVDNANQG